MVIINNHYHSNSIIQYPKLPYPKSFAAQDNGTINMGVTIEEPDDGQDDQDQDGSEDKTHLRGKKRRTMR